MSRKPQISFRVSADDVPQKVSGEFKGLIQSKRLTDPEYTVVSFSGMKGNSTSIVDSKNLIKALEKCESRPDRIIVAAHDYTLEARSLMEERGIIAIFARDFGWTDERWEHIRSTL
jgi:hypothetical protein